MPPTLPLYATSLALQAARLREAECTGAGADLLQIHEAPIIEPQEIGITLDAVVVDINTGCYWVGPDEVIVPVQRATNRRRRIGPHCRGFSTGLECAITVCFGVVPTGRCLYLLINGIRVRVPPGERIRGPNTEGFAQSTLVEVG